MTLTVYKVDHKDSRTLRPIGNGQWQMAVRETIERKQGGESGEDGSRRNWSALFLFVFTDVNLRIGMDRDVHMQHVQ